MHGALRPGIVSPFEKKLHIYYQYAGISRLINDNVRLYNTARRKALEVKCLKVKVNRLQRMDALVKLRQERMHIQ